MLQEGTYMGVPLKKEKKTELHGLRVCERTIPTEQPPLAGDVIANFLQIEDATWSA
jgi:hypothetical protein